MDKITIEKKFFHLAIDYENIVLFNELLSKVDEEEYKNSDKLGILYRFMSPYRNINLEMFKKVIERLKVNLNGTCYSQTPLTRLVHYLTCDSFYSNNCNDVKVKADLKVIFNYLISRDDVNINKPDRYSGFPPLQTYIMDLRDAKKIDKSVISELINKGANMNFRTKKEGNNLLHHLLRNKTYGDDFSILNYVIFSTDIHLQQKNKLGETPLDIAEAMIIKETEDYETSMKQNNRYWTPTKHYIETATKARDLLKSRLEGGL